MQVFDLTHSKEIAFLGEKYKKKKKDWCLQKKEEIYKNAIDCWVTQQITLYLTKEAQLENEPTAAFNRQE